MISTQRLLFDLPEDEIYLNAAYMTPTPKAVAEAGIQGIKAKMNPAGIDQDYFFEAPSKVRSLFSEIVHGADPDRIAIFPSVSYGMANVVRNIKSGYGNQIIVVEDQFPSAVYPWKENSHFEVTTIKLPSLYKNRGEKLTQSILNAIEDRTAAVCLGTVLWTDGSRYDLIRIAEKCRKHGTLLIVDGTQSVGAMPFDLQTIRPDALICACYKWLLGPYGMAVGYLGEAFDDGQPIENNWINRANSQDFTRLTDYDPTYRPKAQRYNMGEYSSFIHIAMMQKSLEMILNWGVTNIERYCAYLTAELYDSLSNSKIYWIEPDPHFRSNHIIGLHLLKDGMKDRLSSIFRERKIHVSLRGDSLRISPHLYNTKKDIYQLMDVLLSQN
ncbi:MAG TPA: aminotransferase class V-fold PLP-dependent enzyme [Membranihabitans sp.]|nr:aminotransferase class V-fold PLP-dependent enzyme [Membranihabitans sp.]